MAKEIVIIGAGPAGVAAASASRQQDPDSRIRLVSAETLPFYSRIRLPEYMDGRIERGKLVIRDEGWFRERDIDLRLGSRVEILDGKGGRVRLTDGSDLPYDACLIATGAEASVPPFPGRDLPGVVAIRSVEDTEALRARVSEAAHVVAIGGGVLGLEMANAIRSLGAGVAVVEIFPWLLPRQLDREGGAVLQRLLEARGLTFHLDAKVEAIEGEGSVSAVTLQGGQRLPASAVLVSAGIAPATDLAKAAGIEVNRGIVVDERMATSVPGVFAAGDCAEVGGRVYGIWPAAEAQGKVAGTNMAGGAATYSGTVLSHTLKVTGIEVFSTGEIDPDGKHPSEVTQGEGTYRKLVRDGGGNLIGAVLIGDLTDRGKIAAAVRDGKAF
ncbi:MAG: NAD(P)/FAD-dependent oxidoreductase [Planctomycetota bacterium]|jgi:nitrite reductase (NADH) large subunit